MTTRLTRLAYLIPAVLLTLAGCSGGIVTEPGGYIGHPEDITPPGLNTGEGYALVNHPANDMKVKNGYVYIGSNDKLLIVDVDPPDMAHIIAAAALPGSARYLQVDGNHAYVACSGQHECLVILDVSSPSSPNIVKIIPAEVMTGGLVVENGYAYLGGYLFQIFDIDPPESAYLLGHLDTGLPAIYLFDVEDGYLYACTYIDKENKIAILDIDPQLSAKVIASLHIDHLGSITVHNGICCITRTDATDIFEVNPSGSIRYVKSIEMGDILAKPVFGDNFIYFPDIDNGFFMVSIDPLESAHTVWKTELLNGADLLDYENEYLYVYTSGYGLRIFKL
jgi:hypothetical protein